MNNIDKIEYRTAKMTIKVGKTKTTTKIKQVVIFVRQNKQWKTASEACLTLNAIAPESEKNIKLVEVFDAAGLEVPASVREEAEKEMKALEDKELSKREKREKEYLQGYENYMSDKKTRATLAANRRWLRLKEEFKEALGE
jgi:hypothetical protein